MLHAAPAEKIAPATQPHRNEEVVGFMVIILIRIWKPFNSKITPRFQSDSFTNRPKSASILSSRSSIATIRPGRLAKSGRQYPGGTGVSWAREGAG